MACHRPMWLPAAVAMCWCLCVCTGQTPASQAASSSQQQQPATLTVPSALSHSIANLGSSLLTQELDLNEESGAAGEFLSPTSIFVALTLALNAAGTRFAAAGSGCLLGCSCSPPL